MNTAKQFSIPKALVWQAYKLVKADTVCSWRTPRRCGVCFYAIATQSGNRPTRLGRDHTPWRTRRWLSKV
jgi:hypothetical protein